jgi:hypothetical protein
MTNTIVGYGTIAPSLPPHGIVITGTVSTGIDLANGLAGVNVFKTGAIETYGPGITAAANSATTIQNYGSVLSTAPAAYAIQLSGIDSNILNNEKTGLISGSSAVGHAVGVNIFKTESISNAGTIVGIEANGAYKSSQHYYFGGAVAGTLAITNTVGGVITSNFHGIPGYDSAAAIMVNNTAAFTLTNSGLVQSGAGGAGVLVQGKNGHDSLINTKTGVIAAANAYYAIGAFDGASSTISNAGQISGGVLQTTGQSELINSETGTISSSSIGIMDISRAASPVPGGSETVLNQGLITSGLSAVYERAQVDCVTNGAHGVISSATGAGVFVEANYGAGATATIVNAGVIAGYQGVHTAGFAGQRVQGVAPATTIVNAGTIESNIANGLAIQSLGALHLTVDPGSTIIGNVQAASAAGAFQTKVSNVLELASGSTAGTITGIGTQYQGFGTIAIDTKAQWTLVGNASGLASGETVTGFLHGDEIDLTGIAATSGSFAHGTLSLYGANHMLDAKLLLSESTKITSANFSLSSDNAGGVLINLVTPTSAAALVPTHTGL